MQFCAVIVRLLDSAHLSVPEVVKTFETFKGLINTVIQTQFYTTKADFIVCNIVQYCVSAEIIHDHKLFYVG